MQAVYTHEEAPNSFEKSLFLAGPTPRSKDVDSWRPGALKILEELEYDGVVFVPEFRDGNIIDTFDPDWYKKQCDWEHSKLNMSDYAVFWVPRNLVTLPAFTTNVEFGLLARSRKAIFGSPVPVAEYKNRYLQYCAEKFGIPQTETLRDTLQKAVACIGAGALRFGGERNIPIFLWCAPHFQEWYQSQRAVGNYLNEAEVLFMPQTGSTDKVFYWAVHANIHIASEDRDKKNKSEIIFSRWNISSIVLYRKTDNFMDTEVVLVREFRSPMNNSSGFIWELPGGSSPDFSLSPLQIAEEEVWEEVGLKIDPDRFVPHGSRQLMGTMSAHKANLFSVELTEEELAWLKTQKGIARGVSLHDPSGERAYTEIKMVYEIIAEDLVDWSNVGMIMAALQEE